MSLRQQLESFVASAKPLKIVYSTPGLPLVTAMTSRLLVLDSSFNPPHKGHAALIAKSAGYPFPIPSNTLSIATVNTNSVLLLLSLKNADKKSADLDSYCDRLEMMKLLAAHVSEQFGLACAIGLTTKSLFVDKQQVLSQGLEMLYPKLAEPLDLTFLLGFDTLIRFLDPKYYQDESIHSVLAPFFDSSTCFVLSRDTPDYSLDQQRTYHSSLPSSWASRIYLEDADAESLNLSSSLIRKEVASGLQEWKSMTYPDVAAYIESHHLYEKG